MPPAVIGGAIAGVGALGGAAIMSSSAKKAARTQAEAANQAAAVQKQMFERQVELQEPFRQAGIAGQNRLLDLLGLSGNTGAAGYGSAMVPFSQTNFMQDPGYAFRMSEGMKALERSAAAKGLLKSGTFLRGAQEYGQGLASQEYQNAFKRYYDERQNMIAPLEALRTGGQSVSKEIAGNAGTYGANVGNLMTGAGNAMAAGRVGAANAWGNALGQGASIFGNYLAAGGLGGGFNPSAAISSANAGLSALPAFNVASTPLMLPSGPVG